MRNKRRKLINKIKHYEYLNEEYKDTHMSWHYVIAVLKFRVSILNLLLRFSFNH